MRHRSDLERLATLDAETITLVCESADAARRVLDDAVDEYLEMDAIADELLAEGADEDSVFHRQEAAAWRATVTVLRTVLTSAHTGSRSTIRVEVA